MDPNMFLLRFMMDRADVWFAVIDKFRKSIYEWTRNVMANELETVRKMLENFERPRQEIMHSHVSVKISNG